MGRLVFATVLLFAANLLGHPIAAATPASDYRQQGLAYREQERYPEAIAALQKAVNLEPDNLSGRVLLGWTLHRAGNRPEAALALQDTLTRNPFYVPALNALGIVYLVQGELQPAVLTHHWAALLNPNNEIAYYNLSLAYQRLGQYDGAVTLAQRAAQLEPTNPHPRIAAAIAHWSRGDRATAQRVYRQALSLDGRYGNADFLQYLDEAGFSQDQIQLSRQILQVAF